MDKYVISSCFDEEATAEDILFLKKERRTTLKRYVENQTCSCYYILITKYLLKHKYSVKDIKRIIKAHIVLTAYLIIHEKQPGNWRNDVSIFNDVLYKNGVTIDFYLSELDWRYLDCYSCLFNAVDFSEIKKCIAEISDEYKEVAGNNNLISLLNNIMDYFYFGCKFADLKYYNHADLIISYNMNNESLTSFSFESIDLEYQKENWISTQVFKELDIKEKIMGHIINIIIANNNYDFSKEMKIKPLHYYGIMFNEARKKFINDTYDFFDVDTKLQIATINRDKIKKDFRFKYNGKKYIFTKDGIKEL